MKKILIVTTLAASLSGFTALGQGYFVFQTATRAAWDIFTPANAGTPKLGATMNATFLWGSGAALIAGIQAGGTVTNSLAANAAATANIANDWNAIMTDPAYHLAVDAATSLAPIVAVGANGSISYQVGANFPVTGTAESTPYNIFIIAWDKTYATPAAARTANAAVGWSAIFQYTSGSQIATLPTFGASGASPIGVVSPIPEPATFALAGLGAAAMLIFRRRK